MIGFGLATSICDPQTCNPMHLLLGTKLGDDGSVAGKCPLVAGGLVHACRVAGFDVPRIRLPRVLGRNRDLLLFTCRDRVDGLSFAIDREASV